MLSFNLSLVQKKLGNPRVVFFHLTFCYLYDLTKQGVIECPIPDKDIRRFDANIRLFPPFIDNDICPLTINNTLLQSCYLRNTEWACGVAAYTGNLFTHYQDLRLISCNKTRLIEKVRNGAILQKSWKMTTFSGMLVKCCINISANQAAVDNVD